MDKSICLLIRKQTASDVDWACREAVRLLGVDSMTGHADAVPLARLILQRLHQVELAVVSVLTGSESTTKDEDEEEQP